MLYYTFEVISLLSAEVLDAVNLDRGQAKYHCFCLAASVFRASPTRFFSHKVRKLEMNEAPHLQPLHFTRDSISRATSSQWERVESFITRQGGYIQSILGTSLTGYRSYARISPVLWRFLHYVRFVEQQPKQQTHRGARSRLAKYELSADFADDSVVHSRSSTTCNSRPSVNFKGKGGKPGLQKKV